MTAPAQTALRLRSGARLWLVCRTLGPLSTSHELAHLLTCLRTNTAALFKLYLAGQQAHNGKGCTNAVLN
jgi:hypothetical protein